MANARRFLLLAVALLSAETAFAQFVRQDGTLPLTANWNAGPFAIQSRNSEDSFNPVVYGADPSGVVDSRSAIQQAMDFAAGRPVVLPAGRFVLTGSLVYSPAQ